MTDAELIADFIARRGVTKCPPAIAVCPTGGVDVAPETAKAFSQYYSAGEPSGMREVIRQAMARKGGMATSRARQIASTKWTTERVRFLRDNCRTMTRRELWTAINQMPGDTFNGVVSIADKLRDLSLTAKDYVAQPRAYTAERLALMKECAESGVGSVETLERASKLPGGPLPDRRAFVAYASKRGIHFSKGKRVTAEPLPPYAKGTSRAAYLLTLIEAAAENNTPLPTPTSIAHAIGHVGAGHIASIYGSLVESGKIRSMANYLHRAVTIVATGQTVRSADCPEDWAP